MLRRRTRRRAAGANPAPFLPKNRLHKWGMFAPARQAPHSFKNQEEHAVACEGERRRRWRDNSRTGTTTFALHWKQNMFRGGMILFLFWFLVNNLMSASKELEKPPKAKSVRKSSTKGASGGASSVAQSLQATQAEIKALTAKSEFAEVPVLFSSLHFFFFSPFQQTFFFPFQQTFFFPSLFLGRGRRARWRSTQPTCLLMRIHTMRYRYLRKPSSARSAPRARRTAARCRACRLSPVRHPPSLPSSPASSLTSACACMCAVTGVLEQLERPAEAYNWLVQLHDGQSEVMGPDAAAVKQTALRLARSGLPSTHSAHDPLRMHIDPVRFPVPSWAVHAGYAQPRLRSCSVQQLCSSTRCTFSTARRSRATPRTVDSPACCALASSQPSRCVWANTRRLFFFFFFFLL